MEKPFALIIEDEREIAALFRHVLDMAGFRTELAFHGRVAVERLSNCEPDLVILDLKLPEVSGIEILEIIRKDARLDHTKIIVISAHAYLADGISVEPDLTLLKPVSIEQLTNLITRLKISGKSQKAKPIKGNPWVIDVGIYNRPIFMNRLESSLRQSKEVDQHLFAVLLLKLDQKQGDTQLHKSILREVGESLRSSVRTTDTIATFDQRNIFILIENIPNADIPIMVANRIRERLNESIVDIENKMLIPTRIGILLCDSGYESTEEILRDAEHAQLMAMAQGDEYYKYYYQVSVKK